MKTDLSTTTGSFAAYKARDLAPGADQKLAKNKFQTQGAQPSPSSPDYKLDLSSKLTAPSLPQVSVPDLPVPKVEEALSSEVKAEIKEEAVKKVTEPVIKNGSVKKDLIIFIKGMDVFSSPSKSERGYAGVGRMAESIEGSRIYGWNQQSEILDEIRKIHPDNKVVLVGHSLGGDTAVELANQLDSLQDKFRTVDLLITMDAIGFSNDIIPQNVKRHLNVFGENDLLLNDGPHVARRNEKTTVINILSPEDHVDIDDNKEIQFEVVNLIQKTLQKT